MRYSVPNLCVNKRRKHVLQIKKHINYLHDFQRQFVLVPADKAANNVILVCKKYYLDVVLYELSIYYRHILCA